MPASYPNSIVTLASHSDTTDTIFAADINTPNAEIVAVETGLLNGFQHDLLPLVDDAKSLGSTSKRWLKGWFQDIDLDGTLTFNGVASTALATVTNAICNGRLTLTTVTPVTTADVTAATTLIWTPYLGKYVALYDGVSAWTTLAFTELSIAVPATTSQMYDVFVFNNSGVAALEVLAWTNDTTRATALVLQDGVLVKSGAATRRYLGSFRTTGVSGQTEDSASKRYVWNYYNRVRRTLFVKEATTTWAGSGTIFRQVRGSTANQVEAVVGVADTEVNLFAALMASNSVTNNISFTTAIGFDSTTTVATGSVVQAMFLTAANANVFVGMTTTLQQYPAVGRHLWAWLEKQSDATPANTTFFGDHTATSGGQSGLSGFIEG